MITVLFLYHAVAWCFLRGMKYIIPLIIFLVLAIPSEYLGFSLLVAIGVYAIWQTLITVRQGSYTATNDHGANLGEICKDKRPLTFWAAMIIWFVVGLFLVLGGLIAIIRDFL